MRNLITEGSLCKAITKHLSVRLQYKKEGSWRTFEPYAVFESSTGKILVAGTQTVNDAKPGEATSPKNFEVSLISGLKITEKVFKVDPLFDRSDKKYVNGVICVVK